MGIQIKKYRASSLQGAIEEVRSDLGDDAIILQTETIRDPKLGILGKTIVEVTAAIDRKDEIRFHATVSDDGEEIQAATTPTPTKASTQAPQQKAGWWQALLPNKKQPAPVAATPVPASTRASATPKAPVSRVTKASGAPSGDSMSQLYAMKTFVEPLQKEIDTLKSKVGESGASVMARPARKKLQDPLEIEVQQLRTELNSFILEKRYEHMNLPKFCRQLIHFWTAKGMSGRQILTFLKEIENNGVDLRDDASALTSVSSALQSTVHEAPIFDKTGKRIVVLVGATGVGKTTTIAKMAAYEKMRLKRKVAFISIDDFKIGGADQMQNYARILEVPFLKSRKDVGLEDQIELLDADTIYIDTFGIAPKDTEKMKLLKSTLAFRNPELASRVELHLVVPVGIPQRDVKQFLASFEILAPEFLLFTKWDETENWGGMLSTILESRKPVSLVTYGQSVPDDMSVFSSRKFISTVTDLEAGETGN